MGQRGVFGDDDDNDADEPCFLCFSIGGFFFCKTAHGGFTMMKGTKVYPSPVAQMMPESGDTGGSRRLIRALFILGHFIVVLFWAHIERDKEVKGNFTRNHPSTLN
jgi:hypothetical protein